MNNIELLESKIEGKIRGIKLGTLTPKESGIGSLLNKLKPLDEPSYNELLSKYKIVLENLK